MVPKPPVRLWLFGEASAAPRLGISSPGGPVLSSGPELTEKRQGSRLGAGLDGFEFVAESGEG